MPDRNLVLVLYTADDGTQYRTKMDIALVGQQSGGVSLTGAVQVTTSTTAQEIPELLRPRGVYVRATGSKPRFVPCMTQTAPLYEGTATTVSLQQLGVAPVTYQRHKAKSERDHRKAAGIE